MFVQHLKSQTPCRLLGMYSLPRAAEELPLFAYESCDMLFASHSLISVCLKPDEGGFAYCLYNLQTLSESSKSKVQYTCVFSEKSYPALRWHHRGNRHVATYIPLWLPHKHKHTQNTFLLNFTPGQDK